VVLGEQGESSYWNPVENPSDYYFNQVVASDGSSFLTVFTRDSRLRISRMDMSGQLSIQDEPLTAKP
jgi:hypothetical protein